MTTDRTTLTKVIKVRARDLGFDKVGIVPAEALNEERARLQEWLGRGYHGEMPYLARDPEQRTNPRKLFPDARSVVVVALNYYTPHQHSVRIPTRRDSDRIQPASGSDAESLNHPRVSTGKVSRYAWGDDYHDVVADKLRSLLSGIKEEFPQADGKICVDIQPAMDKAWAVRAGLGWMGKHTNVITPEFGSWVFIGELLLNLELDYDAQEIADQCGSCTLCIDACPTSAIVAPYLLDANLCISHATIESRAAEIRDDVAANLEGWLYGCDICQDVCPWNHTPTVTTEDRFQPREANVDVALNEILELGPETYAERFRGSAMKRAKLPACNEMRERCWRIHETIELERRHPCRRIKAQARMLANRRQGSRRSGLGLSVYHLLFYRLRRNSTSSRGRPLRMKLIIVIGASVMMLLTMNIANAQSTATPATLRKLADDYYNWRNQNYPVFSSDNGLHTWDHKLTDYSPGAIAARRARVVQLLAQVNRMRTDNWKKDDQIDWLLFRAQLEGAVFFDRVMDSEHSDPQIYVNECSNSIFSLLKKEYDSPRNRALSATARLQAMPAVLQQGERNLTRPVKLYAQLAIDSARSIDPLFKDSMMAALAKGLSTAEMNDLVSARDTAIGAIHAYADWLEKRLKTMPAFTPMGEANYNYLLKHVYLLPLDGEQVEMLGQTELARARAMESMLLDPSLADPDPSRAAVIPRDQEDFLKAYERRETEIITFLQEQKLVTLPSYLGRFEIRQLPEAFKLTSPGGFMNAPGVYDKDPTGFYFIPTYNPKSGNFYIRAAIEDPRPILGHEGIPGHFLQLSIANHLKDEIRRQHGDGVIIEGWALYGEEMMMREGLYPFNSASQGQVLRLSRYRAARIGVDVNLHTGRWTFEQAVKYFMEAGGLDREAAEGEAAGAAASPSQKITYITGKWQIMRLLGKYRDAKGKDFRLGQFHDDLIKNGSLPLSIVEWIMLDDRSSLDEALK